MKNAIIENQTTFFEGRLRSGIFYYPYPVLDLLVYNPHNRIEKPNTFKFLIDTGASISIMNNRLTDIFKNTKEVKEVQIFYGNGGKKWLPVYETIIQIKGKELMILAAHDPELSSPFSILGQHTFLENFVNFVYNKNNFKMI